MKIIIFICLLVKAISFLSKIKLRTPVFSSQFLDKDINGFFNREELIKISYFSKSQLEKFKLNLILRQLVTEIYYYKKNNISKYSFNEFTCLDYWLNDDVYNIKYRSSIDFYIFKNKNNSTRECHFLFEEHECIKRISKNKTFEYLEEITNICYELLNSKCGECQEKKNNTQTMMKKARINRNVLALISETADSYFTTKKITPEQLYKILNELVFRSNDKLIFEIFEIVIDYIEFSHKDPYESKKLFLWFLSRVFNLDNNIKLANFILDYNPEEILMTMLILENKGNVKVDTKKYYFLSNEFLNDLEKYFKLKKKRILELIKIINSKKLR